MKKNAFLLPLLALAVALVGCKPTPEKNSDTGSDDVAGSAGKSLVKKMVVTAAYTDTAYDEEYDGSATLNFAYEEGRLASITGTGEYVYRYMDYSEPPLNPESKAEEGVWMEDKTSGTATVGFAYDGENVNVSLSMDATYDEAGYGPEHYSGTGTMALQMNADKAVSSARSKFVSEEESSDEWLVNFEYADNFLTRVAVPYEGMDASYGLEFGWENGNIVRVGSYDEYVKGSKKSPAQNRRNGKTDLGTAMTRLMFPLCGILSSSSSSDRGHGSTKKSVDWYADYHMEYTSHENKSNVDIASLAWTILGGIVDPSQFVGVFGFTGIMSKNLPESLYEDDEYEPDGRWDYGRVEYVLDADGLMEKVTVFDEEGNRVGTISFEY